ncbi:hypothetical protein [Flavobacterium sp. GCM10023249]|uniref:hypothetical protein n=1 Tax=unclassified Flavobacterium TaxID=196869 RepID=UPI003624353B
MKKHLVLIYTVLIGFFVSSCSVTESDTESYIARFYENKIVFERLVQKVNEDQYALSTIGHSINKSKVHPGIQEDIEDLEIATLQLSTTDCHGITQTELSVNWTTHATVTFIKSKCPSIETKKGYHSKNQMIEVWGLGEGWTMMIDYDFI